MSDWGPWRLNAETYVLEYFEDDEYRYEVDLERCLDSAEVLDYVCQVAGKTWATHEVVAGLVTAITNVLDPQANLCSFGISKQITAASVRRRVGRLIEQGAVPA
jgi:hypothetical protein